MTSNSRIISKTITSEINFGDDGLCKKSSKKFKRCAKPLEKPESSRLKRVIGYEVLAEETTKWESTINARRREDQSTFPLNKQNLRFIYKEKYDQTPMNTDMEKEIHSLLAGSKLVTEKKDTVEEKAIKDAMMLSKVKERSKGLWKKRLNQKILEQRIGDKIYLANKSKSKTAHRIKKREKMRNEKGQFGHLLEEDPAAALEMLDKIDLIRVTERMSLRHKSSKWVHKQTGRAANDTEARKAVKENDELRRELLDKLEQVKEVQKKLVEENDVTCDFLVEATEKEDLEELKVAPKRLIFKDKLAKNMSKMAETEEKFEEAMENLFDEQIEKEFNEEKIAAEEAKVTTNLKKGKRAGWNSWAGPGIVEPIKLKEVKGPTDQNKFKKKKGRSNVIYHESRDLHSVPINTKIIGLPYPFTSVEDYDEYISKPIGRQFVTETCHKSLIAPPVVTKAGVVIEPMGEESLLKHEKGKPRRGKKRLGSNKNMEDQKKLKTIK